MVHRSCGAQVIGGLSVMAGLAVKPTTRNPCRPGQGGHRMPNSWPMLKLPRAVGYSTGPGTQPESGTRVTSRSESNATPVGSLEPNRVLLKLESKNPEVVML